MTYLSTHRSPYFAHSIFINRCALCDHECLNLGLCRLCEGLFEAREEPKCGRCDAARVGGFTSAWCTRCIKKKPSYSRAWGVFDYSGPAGDLVKQAKFSARTDAALMLGAQVGQNLPDELRHDPPDKVCPLPLHPRRVQNHGINLPLILAHTISNVLGCPLARWRLSRVRNTIPQRGLGVEERRRNVRRAFRGRWVKGRDILLVDDVFTTGATAEAASRALLNAACSRVRVLTATYVDGSTALSRRTPIG